MEKRRKNEGQGASWALIVVLFALRLWPIALILLFIKLFGRDKQLPPSKNDEPEPPVVKARTVVRMAMKSPTPGKSSAHVLKIAGWITLALGLMKGIGTVDSLLFWTGGLYGRWIAKELIHALAISAAGGALLASGYSMSRSLRRFQQYLAAMGDREAVSLVELSGALGRPIRRVEKDLRQMIDRNYFGGRAYVHQELGYFLRGEGAEETLRRELAREAAAQQPQTPPPSSESPAETEEGYIGILREIRRANDAIADPILSAKIDELERIAGQIFRIVEQEPEKAERISGFFHYYLPTTRKLLDSYLKFEQAGVEGENLSQAKARIENSMDAIVQGFTHQLDQLYRGDALDVDQDIRVLEYMLHRDTATVEQDFGAAPKAEQS